MSANWWSSRASQRARTAAVRALFPRVLDAVEASAVVLTAAAAVDAGFVAVLGLVGAGAAGIAARRPAVDAVLIAVSQAVTAAGSMKYQRAQIRAAEQALPGVTGHFERVARQAIVGRCWRSVGARLIVKRDDAVLAGAPRARQAGEERQLVVTSAAVLAVVEAAHVGDVRLGRDRCFDMTPELGTREIDALSRATRRRERHLLRCGGQEMRVVTAVRVQLQVRVSSGMIGKNGW